MAKPTQKNINKCEKCGKNNENNLIAMDGTTHPICRPCAAEWWKIRDEVVMYTWRGFIEPKG